MKDSWVWRLLEEPYLEENIAVRVAVPLSSKKSPALVWRGRRERRLHMYKRSSEI